MEEGDATADGDDPNVRSCEQLNIDLLSALPDALLLHVLSFLHMRDVVKTALLSRRWRHLWTFNPCLDFCGRNARPWTGDGYYLPSDFIDQALLLHEGTKVQAFCAAARPPENGKQHEISEFEERVDSWVLFALRCGVEELRLDCLEDADRDSIAAPYRLPDGLFTCESLVYLSLRFCYLDPPPQISMGSLKSLTLCNVYIDNLSLKEMLSGCPSLECLTLVDCNPSLDRDICVDCTNSRLKTLKMYDIELDDGSQYAALIYASSVRTLIFGGHLRAYYDIKDLSSIVAASLDFTLMLFQQMGYGDCKRFEYLLCNLRRVQVLELCSWCIQALSVRASKSSKFEVDFSVTSLKLTIGFVTCEFPGIFYALRSFTKVELLSIEITRENWRNRCRVARYYVDEKKYVMSSESSANMLQHLKVVNLFGLARAICVEEGNTTVEEILEKYQNGFEFMRFLLKNSPVLERLTISALGKANKLTNNNRKVLFRFASRLLALPRASPNALVIVQEK